jgi:hypothetical protein
LLAVRNCASPIEVEKDQQCTDRNTSKQNGSALHLQSPNALARTFAIACENTIMLNTTTAEGQSMETLKREAGILDFFCRHD